MKTMSQAGVKCYVCKQSIFIYHFVTPTTTMKELTTVTETNTHTHTHRGRTH
jgi:predicted peroxiredoxin